MVTVLIAHYGTFVYIGHASSRDPHSFLFGSPASPFSFPLPDSSAAVALTVGKNLYREPVLSNSAVTIGRFGLPSDSSASADATSENPLSTASLEFHSAPMSPNDMIEDPPAAEPDRVLALERQFDDMRSEGDATRQLLQSILERLGPEPTTPASPMRRPVSR